jgi:RNA polymerase sigma-70 factor (ECF subfamily)
MPAADPAEDLKAVRACLDGEAEAFSLLLSRYETMVYNLVLRIVRQREEAQDITQEAFLNAYTHLADFDQSRSFAGWLFGIARNQALYRLRGLKHREVACDTLEEHGSSEASTGDKAEVKELEREVLKCLDALPEKYRSVLVMRHMLERTYQEISDMLSMNLGTVKTNIHLGRKMLREKLQRQSLID